jgi:hypothetical protein
MDDSAVDLSDDGTFIANSALEVLRFPCQSSKRPKGAADGWQRDRCGGRLTSLARIKITSLYFVELG